MRVVLISRWVGILSLMLVIGSACASSVTPKRSGARAEPSEFGSEGGESQATSALAKNRGERDRDFRAVYFDFDAYTLRSDAREALRHNAMLLRSDPELNIRIEGNCDERGSTEYNLALGKKRAEAAKQYLVDLGVESTRVSTLSYGEENPAIQGSDERSWALNRRDDFSLR